jgi:hypothetical protein
MQALDIRRLQRDGLLKPERSFSWSWWRNGKQTSSIFIKIDTNRIILRYLNQRNGQNEKLMEYPVQLSWTHCHLGGQRPWFHCPLPGCGRRVALLFGGAVFACRHCQQLTYESQKETYDDRAARRADAIRRRLCWDVGIFNPKGVKPKGMHWRTFWRLEAEHEKYANISLAGMATKLGLKS